MWGCWSRLGPELCDVIERCAAVSKGRSTMPVCAFLRLRHSHLQLDLCRRTIVSLTAGVDPHSNGLRDSTLSYGVCRAARVAPWRRKICLYEMPCASRLASIGKCQIQEGQIQEGQIHEDQIHQGV